MPLGVITPVILAGGSGSRLWPLSRTLHPKRFLPPAGELAMLQETAPRIAGDGFAAPLVICNEKHRFFVAEQPRAITLRVAGEDGLSLVMPSDHVFAAPERFPRAVATATNPGAVGAVAGLERSNPAMVEARCKALSAAGRDPTFRRLGADAFAASPPGSIDHAVMEKTSLAVVVAVDMGWQDVGAWSALWDIGEKDANGNVVQGAAVLHGARNVHARSAEHPVAVVGLEDAAEIAPDNAILVADHVHVQGVKHVVDHLKAERHGEHVLHTTVHRPWGAYRGVDRGSHVQVKRIVVKSGKPLSLQMHHHRAERWIGGEGAALATRGVGKLFVYQNKPVCIPLGTVRRLENPGKVPLRLIEVQSGGSRRGRYPPIGGSKWTGTFRDSDDHGRA